MLVLDGIANALKGLPNKIMIEGHTDDRPLNGGFLTGRYQPGQEAPNTGRAARLPERFDPERWIGVKPDPYTWLPFGGGTRRCIGMAFAQFEMRVVLQTVVPRARMHLAAGEARVVRRGITLAPAGGTRIVLDERLSPRAAA